MAEFGLSRALECRVIAKVLDLVKCLLLKLGGLAGRAMARHNPAVISLLCNDLVLGPTGFAIPLNVLSRA